MKFEFGLDVLFLNAIKVGFVSLLGTIISARLADKERGTRFDQAKEVRALAFGNAFSGSLGGAPCMGALLMTSVNLKAGGTMSYSQLLNSMFSVAIIVFLMPAFVYTPIPCMAAILFVSATKLIPVSGM